VWSDKEKNAERPVLSARTAAAHRELGSDAQKVQYRRKIGGVVVFRGEKRKEKKKKKKKKKKKQKIVESN